jgi:hypothetical protein
MPTSALIILYYIPYICNVISISILHCKGFKYELKSSCSNTELGVVNGFLIYGVPHFYSLKQKNRLQIYSLQEFFIDKSSNLPFPLECHVFYSIIIVDWTLPHFLNSKMHPWFSYNTFSEKRKNMYITTVTVNIQT